MSSIEFPTHISKAYMNSSKRRKDGNGKQTWRIYGYDIHGHFKTERIKGNILGMKPTGIKLYHKRTGACINCGKHCIVATENKNTPINCGKCVLESP